MRIESVGTVEPRLPETVEHDGYRLGTVFQPIISLSHRRAVGHEALLRATDADGAAVAPLHLLQRQTTDAARREFDLLSLRLHGRNFARQRTTEPWQWLFVNLRPQAFLQGLGSDRADRVRRLVQGCGLVPNQVVIEVTEEAVADGNDFEACAQAARDFGFLLALDDFGAGHSNFDRVWRIRPDIVKLDRSLVQRGASDAAVARVIHQMVSLLHQCGALVLMEGIETPDEACLAIDSDVDMVQGYLFGRPQPRLQLEDGPSAALLDAWAGFEQRAWQATQARRERIEPFQEALRQGAALLAEGRSLSEAAAGFLVLPGAELCFLLDERGIQHGASVRAPGQEWVSGHARFAPLQDGSQACWSRRPYFRRAMDEPGRVHATRPYLSIHGAHLCKTVSIGLMLGGRRYVFCGDVIWD